ncbi:MAG: ATP-dependent DNA helicase RecG [Propionibacteriaceae bacterium]|nr:ATP-dependent DNA helicase RecG [Propionibacteriaceae bacterium]
MIKDNQPAQLGGFLSFTPDSLDSEVTTIWKTRTFAELAAPLTKAVGADTAKAFRALNVETVGDLLRLLPRHLMSGTALTDITALVEENRGSEEYVALKARVAKVDKKGEAPRERIEVRLTDGKGWLTATFFGRSSLIRYWQQLLSSSDRGIFAGKLGWFNREPQLAHPAFVMITDQGLKGSAKSMNMMARVNTNSFVGLYPQTAKLPTWTVAESISLAFTLVSPLEDPLPAWVREAAGLVDLDTAFQQVHNPLSEEAYAQGVRRLLFDEAFGAQVAMAYRRHDTSTHTAVPRPGQPDGLLTRFDAQLPFTLTDEQIAIGDQIGTDLAKTRPMQRLLQGEVGSGKTVVALRAMLAVVDSGGQAVLMAPTEVLAHQHASTILQLMGELAGAGLLAAEHATDVVLLTGAMTAATKGDAIERIANGQAGIVIGTHALLSTGVKFHDLGLVVVDEQHRFGVEQRNALAQQDAARPHVLVMTATPIPRSVAMTIFGDLDMSTLSKIPAGRAEVSTTVVDQVAHPAWVDRAWTRVREEVSTGRQVYIVAPRIGAGDGKEGRSVLELAQTLGEAPLAGLRIAVLHGRLPSSEKTEIMTRFGAGQIDVLIATSMIEVGVDHPNASMMVICDAEWFGISQLHQLRGRIGRGAYPGVCLLLTSAAEGTGARNRLEAVAATRDGFALAEADLAQRREGDVLGMTQAGRRSSLRLLKVLEHADLIEEARTLAEQAVQKDPTLSDPGVADYVMEIESRAEASLEDAA